MKENILLQSGEEITPVVGYEGLYSITSFGRVWSHLRYKKGCGDSIRKCGGLFLKPDLTKNGYLQVRLHINAKKKACLVHRLEAIAFIPNPLNLPEVNHKDGNKQNNYVGTAAKNYEDGNLEWCTNQENHNHAMSFCLKYKKHSIYHGVTFHIGKRQKKNPWEAQIRVNKKQTYIGNYKTEIEAAQAYNAFVIENNLNRPLNYLRG